MFQDCNGISNNAILVALDTVITQHSGLSRREEAFRQLFRDSFRDSISTIGELRFFLFLNSSIRTEMEGEGAISHLSITQASVRHSGIYTCSVSDTISQSLRLHIIDGELL